MKDRILKTGHGEFEFKTWDGLNVSGIRPVGDKLLVLCDKALKQTRGGVMLPEELAETQSMSATTGIVIAIGDLAFRWHSELGLEWMGERPEIGDRIYFQKYAGQEYPGVDGEMYRVMQDRSVGGISIPVEATMRQHISGVLT